MASSTTETDYKQEIRFAVVMYGGVSLAIYINGVAQELFHLVSATARQKAGGTTAVGVDALSGTERVYRKLSYILSNKEFRMLCQDEATRKAAQKEPYRVPDAPDKDTIETRFVIDIMSGASAGGINAIFLAKALANNQNIDQLKELWVNEGDIGTLINDKRSVADLTLKIQKPPLSFLNSRRMYLKLLKAFDDMEKGQTDVGAESRFLDETELDLFVTTTDIQGLALPIRLSDSVVYERRHRNVFHLKYASPEAALGNDKDRNQFVSANNPFLAFAARCTSSFPFAFEPMKLSDIDEVLDTCPEYRGKTESRGTVENWGRFFNRNLLQATASIANRPYGDGGVLDNKPFSYAADTIARRYSPLPVDRKLLYIEPSPEHAEDENLEINQVDALQNVKAALLDLPAYETIREDLQRLQERNNLITRVNDITDAIEQDLEDARVQRPSLRKGEWETLDLAGMVQRFGIYYIPYRRLRIEAATDELARTVAKMLMLNEDSAEYVAVRALIRAWRGKNYKDENVQKHDERLELLAQQLTAVTASQPTPEQLELVERQLRSWLQLNVSDAYRDSVAKTAKQDGSETAENIKTANQFLLHYDFKYWLRRLAFVRSKIDQLLDLEKVPFDANHKFPPTEKQQAVLKRLNKYLGDRKYEQLLKKEKEELTTELKRWRSELVQLYKTFRIAGRDISSSQTSKDPNAPNFAEKLRKIKLDPKVLDYLLGTVSASGEDHPFSKLKVEDCAERAEQLFNDKDLAKKFNAETLADDLDAAARDLRCFLQTVLGPAWRKCETLLGPRVPVVQPLPPDKVDTENCDSVQVTYTDRPPETPQAAGMRKYLWHYLSKFDDYDQVRFPIMYGTDSSESDVVEVFRISPEDAPSLIDERAESRKPNGRLKLAGTSLHHFGAFLDRVWRQNDIMWGRLDGAERLITSMMPYPNDAPLRTALIREAHASILREELSTESRRQLSTLMSEALIRASSGEPIEAAVEKVMKDLSDSSPVKTRLASAITAIFDDDQSKQDDDRLVTFVRLGYQVNRKLDPKGVLEMLSRSTQTIGGIFEDLANKSGLDGNSLSWIARLGQFFWGFVQIAVPNSILNKLVHHWLYILYLFEVVIILFGVVLGRPGAQQFGWTALGITAIANVLILILKDLMRMRRSVLKLSVILVFGTILILAAIGLLKVAGFLGLAMTGGEDGLPPLAWLSSTAGNALSVVEPLKPYLPPLVGLVLIALVFLLLYLAEKYDFGGARETKSFEPIKLRGFKRRDMKEIHIRPDSGTTYSVVARLLAQPPPDWVKAFNRLWEQNHPDIRVGVYRDQVRFESDAQGIHKIWDDLKTTIDSVNSTRWNEVETERQQLEQKRKEEKARKKKESKVKWETFRKLSS